METHNIYSIIIVASLADKKNFRSKIDDKQGREEKFTVALVLEMPS